jgi:HAD superfamily hydrolase (TIGR01509 family)
MNPQPFRLKPFQAVVFDMDGTLLDTEMVFRDIVFEVTRGLGYDMRDEVHLAMVGASHEATNALLVEAYGVAFPYTMFDDQCRAAMRIRMAEAVPLKTGALEIVTELRARGVPLAVATSSRRHHADPHLRAAGLFDLLDAVVTRDDVEHPKPHPEPYLTAARRLGVAAEQCLAIEDSHSGVKAAHAAGMQTVMVPDLVRPSREVEALCAAVLDSLHHVRAAAFGSQDA